jgi:hypothetical protein
LLICSLNGLQKDRSDNGECWVYINGRYEPGDFAERLARIDHALAKMEAALPRSLNPNLKTQNMKP